jgi:ribosomal protein S18 acetylase RimI-like enzyme
MAVQIRPAHPDDLPRLRDIFRRASLSNDGDREALLEHPEYLVLPAEPVLAGHTRVAVRLEDSTVVGFATVEIADGVAELVDLFVDPGAMRRGVARALLADAVTGLRALGVGELQVTGNDHALAFYTAVGFEEIGRADTPLGPGRRLRLDASR